WRQHLDEWNKAGSGYPSTTSAAPIRWFGSAAPGRNPNGMGSLKASRVILSPYSSPSSFLRLLGHPALETVGGTVVLEPLLSRRVPLLEEETNVLHGALLRCGPAI